MEKSKLVFRVLQYRWLRFSISCTLFIWITLWKFNKVLSRCFLTKFNEVLIPAKFNKVLSRCFPTKFNEVLIPAKFNKVLSRCLPTKFNEALIPAKFNKVLSRCFPTKFNEVLILMCLITNKAWCRWLQGYYPGGVVESPSGFVFL